MTPTRAIQSGPDPTARRPSRAHPGCRYPRCPCPRTNASYTRTCFCYMASTVQGRERGPSRDRPGLVHVANCGDAAIGVERRVSINVVGSPSAEPDNAHLNPVVRAKNWEPRSSDRRRGGLYKLASGCLKIHIAVLLITAAPILARY